MKEREPVAARDEAQMPDRRQAQVDGKMRSKLIPDDVEEQLMRVTGLTKADLYNRRGGIAERGLAALLEPGDRVVDVLPDHVVIETKDGARQSYWNLARELPFLTTVDPDAAARSAAVRSCPPQADGACEGTDEAVGMTGDEEGDED